MRLPSVKEKFHSDDSAAAVFFPVGPAGKGEEGCYLGAIQAVSALPVLRDSGDVNPGYLAAGPGVAGICPWLPGVHSNLSRKMEARVGQPYLGAYLVSASGLEMGGCWAEPAILLEGGFRCAEP